MTHAAGVVAHWVNLIGKASTITGRIAEKAARALSGTVGGVGRGAAEMTSNAVDAAALTTSRIEDVRHQSWSLGQVVLERTPSHLHAIESARSRRRKGELPDLLAEGGSTLRHALCDPVDVPPQAEALAYPGRQKAAPLFWFSPIQD